MHTFTWVKFIFIFIFIICLTIFIIGYEIYKEIREVQNTLKQITQRMDQNEEHVRLIKEWKEYHDKVVEKMKEKEFGEQKQEKDKS